MIEISKTLKMILLLLLWADWAYAPFKLFAPTENLADIFDSAVCKLFLVLLLVIWKDVLCVWWNRFVETLKQKIDGLQSSLRQGAAKPAVDMQRLLSMVGRMEAKIDQLTGPESSCEDLSNISEATLQELEMQVQQRAFRITTEREKRRCEPPSEFFCPITRQIMEHPVIAVDGLTYERSAISRWFADNNTSPLTNLPLEDLSLRPNQALRNLITEHPSRMSSHENSYAYDSDLDISSFTLPSNSSDDFRRMPSLELSYDL